MKADELKQQIRELIADNNLESAIELLSRCYEKNKQLDSILLQSAKHTELRRALRDGLIDFNTFQQKMNRLRADILEFLRLDTAEPTEEYHPKGLKADYKRSLARVSILYLLSHEPYQQHGLSITQLHFHSKRKSRKYIAETVLELKDNNFLEKNTETKEEVILWKLTAAGLRLAEELNDSLFRR